MLNIDSFEVCGHSLPESFVAKMNTVRYPSTVGVQLCLRKDWYPDYSCKGLCKIFILKTFVATHLPRSQCCSGSLCCCYSSLTLCLHQKFHSRVYSKVTLQYITLHLSKATYNND